MKKQTLPKRPPQKRLPFKMQDPNDNLEAYGWALQALRHLSPDGHIAGRPVFMLPLDMKILRKYGVDLEFLNPKYVQYMLDQQPEINKGLEKVRAAGYTPEALEKFNGIVVKAFEENVLVDIAQRFFKVAPLVAQFYAAKLAYEDVHGVESDNDKDDKPQIEAKTTKSRR